MRELNSRRLLESISVTHGPSAPGFLGSTVYEALDSSDILVEIAGWETAEAQAAAVAAASAEGVYAPVLELVELRSGPRGSVDPRATRHR